MQRRDNEIVLQGTPEIAAACLAFRALHPNHGTYSFLLGCSIRAEQGLTEIIQKTPEIIIQEPEARLVVDVLSEYSSYDRGGSETIAVLVARTMLHEIKKVN